MKKLSPNDWDRIRGYAVDIANASRDGGGNIIYRNRRRAMLRFLNELESRYGQCVDLLATKADYVETKWYRLRLLKRALKLALAQDDKKNIALIIKDIKSLHSHVI